MKVARILLLLLLALSVAMAGCNSDDDDDSSSTSSGAVTTAFIDGGDVAAEYYSGGTWKAVPGVTGTVENSVLKLTCPADVENYMPMIVSVTGSEMLMGQTPNPTLQSPLSKLVESSSDLDYLYLSIFSSFKAEAYKVTIDTGGTKVEASAAAVSAMESVFLALGLSGTSLTAANIDQINPTTSNATQAVDLEKAQQSLAKVLDVSDQNGLNGLAQRMAPIASDAANKAKAGSRYTASQFADFCQNTLGQSDPPATIVKDNEALINGSVRNTFESSPENVDITGKVAFERSQVVTVDESAVIALDIDGSDVVAMYAYSETARESEAFMVYVRQADGQNSTSAKVNASASDGLLLSMDGKASWSPELYDVTPAGSGKAMYVKIPAEQPAGRYPITVTCPADGLTNTLMVEVLEENTVAMKSLVLAMGKSGDPDEASFLQMDSSNKLYVPEDALGDLEKYNTGTDTKPEPWMIMTVVGEQAEMSSYKLKFKMPDGLVIVEGSEESTYKEATINVNGTNWTLGTDADWLELKDIGEGDKVRAATLSPAMSIKANKKMPFGAYTFTSELYYEETIVASYSTNMYVLTTIGKTTLAKMEMLSYNTVWNNEITEPCVVEVQSHDPDIAPDEVMLYDLYNATQKLGFRAEAKTWECMALDGGKNSGDYTLLAPEKAAVYHEQATNNYGGFTTGETVVSTSVKASTMEMVHNLEGAITTYDADTNGTFLIMVPNATVSPDILAVSVGSNLEMTQLNYEMINMKAWYVDGDETSDKVQTSASTRFQSNATTP